MVKKDQPFFGKMSRFNIETPSNMRVYKDGLIFTAIAHPTDKHRVVASGFSKKSAVRKCLKVMEIITSIKESGEPIE